MNRLIDSIRRVRATFRPIDTDGDAGPDVPLAGRRVLIVYLFEAVGDAVLLGPILKALLDGGAKRPIGVLARPNAARMLKLLDLPLKIHVLPDALHLPPEDPAAPATRKAWRTAEVKAEEAKLAKALAARKYEIAADLTFRNHVDARRWLHHCGAEVRLGWRAARAPATDGGLTWGTEDLRLMADRHWTRAMVAPLRSLGVTAPAFDVGFDLSDKAVAKAQSLFTATPRVVLVPGSRSENKRWDPERFVRIGRWVTEEAKGSAVVVGAPSEGPLVRGIVKSIGTAAAAYTGKDLAPLVALIQAADAVVTNDTGPMHLAFLTQTPTVAVFTWMSPLCWGPPVTDPRHVVLRVPDDPAEDAGGIYGRAVLHYLDGLLARGR